MPSMPGTAAWDDECREKERRIAARLHEHLTHEEIREMCNLMGFLRPGQFMQWLGKCDNAELQRLVDRAKKRRLKTADNAAMNYATIAGVG